MITFLGNPDNFQRVQLIRADEFTKVLWIESNDCPWRSLLGAALSG